MSYPSDGLLPGFKWLDVPGAYSGGSFPEYATDGPARIMCHMTVGMNISEGYIQGHRVPPQLWVNPFTGERWQNTPLQYAGKALYQQQFGEAWTNKHGYTVQIEIVGIPVVNAVTYTDQQNRWIGEQVIAPIMRWFRDMGIPYDMGAVRYHTDSSGSASEFWWGRMGDLESVVTGGIMAHIDEFANDHWDCSVERVDHWHSYAVAVLGGAVPSTTPIGQPSAPSDGIPTGDDTYAVQQFLNDHNGAGLDVDGDYGPLTTQAVVNWQHIVFPNNPAEWDGAWGPKTAQATREFLAGGGVSGPAPAVAPPTVQVSQPAAPQGSQAPPWPGVYLVNYTSGGGTAQWQQQMANRGWSIGVDDEYGSQSEGICRQFQAEKGLEVDGIVGPNTWAAAWNAPIT